MNHLPAVYFRPEGTPISDLKPGEAVITKRETSGDSVILHAFYVPYRPVDYIKVTLEVADDGTKRPLLGQNRQSL